MDALRPYARRIALVLAAVALVAVVVIAISSCGDDKEATQTLDKAFSAPIGSADIALDGSVRVKGIPQLEQPIRLQVRGPYRSGGERTVPAVDLGVNLFASGQSFAAGLVSTGQNAWVKFMGQAYEVGPQVVAQANQRIAASAGQRRGRALTDLGIDPRRWLENPSIEGDERVAGTETTHITAGVDVGRMLEDLNTVGQKASAQAGGAAPRQLSAEQRDRIKRIVQNPTFDVFVGKDDNKVRRLATVLDLEVPKEDQRAAGGAQSGKITFSIEFDNVGSPGPITPPQTARPIRDLTTQLLQLFGGGAAGGAGAGAGAAPGAGTTP